MPSLAMLPWQTVFGGRSLFGKLINLGLTQTDYISGFMHPSNPTRTKIPSFESAYEIVLTDAKFITKQQYSIAIYGL